MYYNFLIHSFADGHLGRLQSMGPQRVGTTSLSLSISCPSYCKQCCNGHWGTILGYNSFNSGFLSCVCPAVGIAGLYGNFIPIFLRNLHTVLHSGCINLHCRQLQKVSIFSTFSPEFIVCRFFDDGYSDLCEIKTSL